jgi:LytS/YehU family sensor histidine kinase
MTEHPFIFSNEPKYRIKRHVYFWVSWCLFQTILYGFVHTPETSFMDRLPSSFIDSILYMPSHIFLSYSLMYFVIPYYILRHKYVLSAICIILVVVSSAALSAFTSLYVINPVRAFFLSPSAMAACAIMNTNSFFFSLMAGLRGGISIGGMAAAIKLMKHWYTEGQRNLQLQKENIQSQLQVLKAQVHPHFLFNTLNNIYSYTQDTSGTASRLVMGLSDIIRYMLYECNQPLVPLSKELTMIREYINLERIRYGNQLDLHIDLPGDETRNTFISPLLIIPFVENCFKHGLSNMLEHPWLSFTVLLEGNQMTMKLLNSKPPTTSTLHAAGIGMENARRRLELLYPGKYDLVINNEEEVFIVNLKLELEQRQDISIQPQKPVLMTAHA